MNRPGQLLFLLYLAVFLFSAAVSHSAAASEDIARTVTKLERYVYGKALEGESSERLSRVETDLFGRETGQSPEAKARTLHDFVFKGSSTMPSLDMKVSYLEWRIFKQTREGTLDERIASLDSAVTGFPSREPLAFRVDQLVHLVVDSGMVALRNVKLPKGTMISVKLDQGITSKQAAEGDIIPFTVVNDFFINNILVIGKGAVLSGEVKRVRRGGRFGRSGYISINISTVETIDSTPVPVMVDGFGEDSLATKKIGMAVGASALGYLAMGPVGLVGGAFVRGQDVEVPAGTVVTVKTTQEVSVNGVLIPGK